MQIGGNHKILGRLGRKTAVFWVETTRYCGGKTKNQKFTKICTNIRYILPGVFVHYAQKSTVLRRNVTSAHTHTAPASAQLTTARLARDDTLNSMVVIKHYDG